MMASNRNALHRPGKCQFFLRGCCRYGNRCRYSHDQSDINNNKTVEENNSVTIGEDSRINCTICFESCFTGGGHRLTSLKCGHIFGHSCIEDWLRSQGNDSKCPHCNSSACLEDIIVIYTSIQNTADTEIWEYMKMEREIITKLKEEKEEIHDEYEREVSKVSECQQELDELREEHAAILYEYQSEATKVSKLQQELEQLQVRKSKQCIEKLAEPKHKLRGNGQVNINYTAVEIVSSERKCTLCIGDLIKESLWDENIFKGYPPNVRHNPWECPKYETVTKIRDYLRQKERCLACADYLANHLNGCPRFLVQNGEACKKCYQRGHLFWTCNYNYSTPQISKHPGSQLEEWRELKKMSQKSRFDFWCVLCGNDYEVEHNSWTCPVCHKNTKLEVRICMCSYKYKDIVHNHKDGCSYKNSIMRCPRNKYNLHNCYSCYKYNLKKQ